MNLIERRRKLIIFITLCLIVFGAFIFIATKEGKVRAYSGGQNCPNGNCTGHIYPTGTSPTATCTSTGQENFKCTTCSWSGSNTLPALGHNSGPAATCTSPQKCTRCDNTIVAALGHNFTNYESQGPAGHIMKCSRAGCNAAQSTTPQSHTPGAAATCTQPQKCAQCDYEITGALGGHSYGDWYQSSPVTHSRKCTRCTHIETQNHIPGAAATCEQPQKCTECDYVLQAKTGHESLKPATCLSAEICTKCNKIITAAKGHNPSTEATCTEKQKCTICDAQIKPALGHSFTNYESQGPTGHVLKCSRCNVAQSTTPQSHTQGAAATCTQPQKCAQCDYEISGARGHSYGNWYQSSTVTHSRKCTRCSHIETQNHTPEATCTQSQICTVCNYTMQAIGEHNYGKWYQSSTVTHSRKCTRCSHIETQNHVPNMEEANCYLEKKCKVCLYVMQEKTEHDFSKKIISADYLHSDPAGALEIYYYACSVCDKKGTETYEYYREYDTSYSEGDKCTKCNRGKLSLIKSDVSCTEYGYATYRCNNCKEEFTGYTNPINPSGHDFSVQQEALEYRCNCTTMYYSCSRCGAKGTETYKIDYDPWHIWEKIEIIPVDDYFHVTKVKCKECNERGTFDDDHDYYDVEHGSGENWWKCDGLMRCETCGHETRRKHIPGPVATCEKNQTCERCGVVITNAIGHNYKYEYKAVGERSYHIKYKKCTRKGCDFNEASREYHEDGAKVTCTTDQKCTKCNETLEKALGHDYTDESKWIYNQLDSTNHQITKKCIQKGCKSENTIKENHIPGEISCITEQSCTKCKFVMREPSEHIPGDSATCTRDQICTVCKEVLQKAFGHDFRQTQYWEYFPDNESNHKVLKTCVICRTEKIMETEMHARQIESYNSDKHTFKCKKCGEKCTEYHTYLPDDDRIGCAYCQWQHECEHKNTDVDYDNTNHWRKCKSCHEIKENTIKEHTLSTTATEDNTQTHSYRCTFEGCGYKQEEVHEFGEDGKCIKCEALKDTLRIGKWKTNNYGMHSSVFRYLGNEIIKEELHTYGEDNKCTKCGAIKIEEEIAIAKKAKNDNNNDSNNSTIANSIIPKAGLSMQILVAILVLCVTAIIGFIKMKKYKGI